MRNPVLSRTAVILTTALVLAACGVAGSGDFKVLPEDELPDAIREARPTTTTSTTTTTTTTTVPSTTRPPQPSGPTTTAPRTTTTSTTISSTTTTTVPMELVSLYYVAGTKVFPAVVSEKAPVSAQRKLLDLVERVGMTTVPVRLATAIPKDATLYTPPLPDRGVFTVELGTSPGDVDPRDLPLFFAQIVLTVLAPSRAGQVLFTQRGVPYPAVKGDGTSLAAGTPAVWEDYQDLILADSERPTSTTNGATTTSSVPQ